MKGALAILGSMKLRGPSGDGRASNSGSNAGGGIIEQSVARLRAADDARKAREERLANMNPEYVDATLVECLSSGSETLDDKLAAFKELTAKCGLKSIVLAAFVKDGSPDLDFLQDLPFGLAKCIQFGIQNPILECDLAAPYINWDKYDINDFCALVESRCRWVAANLHAGRLQPPATYINLRDFASAMQSAPARVLALVEFLARLDPSVRPRGIFVNEPAGVHLPQDAGHGVAAVRGVMEAAGWAEGLLLVHVTAGNGLAHATVLECLAAGCNGIVASLCEQGPA
ncbi:hypothetical protein TSOC_003559 [Tetrabaena socialis]|uniref:Uncharacterized protein n=1 Tax=Tetrabaena socialis TaxID=47790 RepID=A0A2J8AB91_9CHLO|nr:hypothetical protein TSOC_003559 [Tetrabaena socialis]|eukprot:PNH09792.1 hypothetical protein TSOC_003559 [Tetrabaena socialis]